MNTHEFDEIRPYEEGEMKQALNDLLADRHFNKMMQGMVPWLPKGIRNGFFKLMFIGVKTPLDFQLRFMKHVVRYVLRKYAHGYSFDHKSISNKGNYLFISNHRDIVLDSAILDLMLHEAHFPTTCEIALGDNLLIYPWIKILVRMNKAFIVRRSLKAKEMLESSVLMSRYMHYSITEKKENIWIAQREGRAKDSSDHTQDALIKMLSLGGQTGVFMDNLKEVNLLPVSISYEYDPNDYLKAREFLLKRRDPGFKKSQRDDLFSMETGLLQFKGKVHFQMTPRINQKLEQIGDFKDTNEAARHVSRIIDQAIHRSYEIFEVNYIAFDILNKTQRFARKYTAEQKEQFIDYLNAQLDKVDVTDVTTEEREYMMTLMLTMYSNPLKNKLHTILGE